MSFFRKLSLVGVVAGLALLAIWGCGGGASNNDQGTSFTALGFWSDDGETGATGTNFPLFTDSSGQVSSTSGGYPNSIFIYIGLENHLSKQFIRVDRVDCRYSVPGADPLLVIPSDAINFGFVLPATGNTPNVVSDVQTGGDSSSSSTTTSGGESKGYLQFPIVTPDIITYLNANINLLPELPFKMTATCSAVGVTQSGDTLRTNEVMFQVIFYDSPECCTGSGAEGQAGFAAGPGNGGTIDSSTDTTSAATESTTTSGIATQE